jgi:carboxypeptidase family protein
MADLSAPRSPGSFPQGETRPPLFVLLGLFGLLAACGGGSSTPPIFPTTRPDTSGNTTLSGTFVSYADRAPLAGVSVVLGSSVATTDAQGRFSLTNLPATGAAVMTASAPGHLFRGVGVTLSQAAAGLSIDAIRDALPFSLLFYRMWARNALESSELQVTKPWTRNPSFYVRMIVDSTTTRVDSAVVDRIRDLFEKSVPELSGGKFRVAAFETGDEVRPAQDGWVNLTFYTQLGGAFGTSTVGGNSGTMSIRYGMVSSATTNPNNCMTPEVSIADHEITHTMGFWHTIDVLVDSFSGTGCPGAPRPDHTRYHSALMYSRPAGNRDPDIDPVPASGVHAPGPVGQTVVACSDSITGRR